MTIICGGSRHDRAAALEQRDPDGFTNADLVWERVQEQAARALRAGNTAAVPALWTEAFEIAERRFDRCDPRRATSLTNRALVLRHDKLVDRARDRLREALLVWDESWQWIDRMTAVTEPSSHALWAAPDQRERHDEPARRHFTLLAAQGRAATAALQRHDRSPQDGLARWLALRPRGLTDARKLLAAVFLIAPGPEI